MNIDMADVKPSLLSWALVGIMATTFIALMKYLLAKYPVPGLNTLFASV